LTDPEPVDWLVLRYLGAFGPATVADARTWSWLTGLRDVFERLRPRLMAFRDEAGRELFDLPGAPRPYPDTPAAARFLPEYDNLMLSHDDRSRVIPPPVAARLTGFVGTFLVDGFVHGQWRADRGRGGATLVSTRSCRSASASARDLVAEGERLLPSSRRRRPTASRSASLARSWEVIVNHSERLWHE